MENLPKLWIAPLSNEVVEASKDLNIGYIISENQVGIKPGYTGFSIYSLRELLPNKQIWRDHSSCNFDILKEDIKVLNGIHVDVFNKYTSESGQTANFIQYCLSHNENILFEVGTEQSIYEYDFEYLFNFLVRLSNNLDQKEFERIQYVVIQSGTGLKDGRNFREFNNKKLIQFETISSLFKLLPKEHNSDYLSNETLIDKVKYCPKLAINIAPELGTIQSQAIYRQLDIKDISIFVDLVKQNKNVNKWISKPIEEYNDYELISIGGHYVINNLHFKELYNKLNKKIIIEDIRQYIKQKLEILI